jgi:hypothetical protein
LWVDHTMATIIVTSTLSRPWMPRNVTAAMLFSAVLGIITLFSALSSVVTIIIALYWLNEHSPSANATVRHLNRRVKYFAAVEAIVAVLFMLFSIFVRAPRESSGLTFLQWLFGLSVLSLLFSAINVCWSNISARIFKELDEFDGVALTDADYRSLRSEQLGGLLAASAQPEFAAAPAP